MKSIAFALCVILLAASCNNQPAATSEVKKDSVAPAPVNLPYKMEYNSWTMGDPQNLKLVLDMYRSWDDNKPDEAATAFGDSTVFDEPEGVRMVTTRATIADSIRSWRGSYLNHYTDVISGMSLHSTDKNEDWVTVQSMTRWTMKDGTQDSIVSTDNWLLKSGKIVYLSSFQQKPVVVEE